MTRPLIGITGRRKTASVLGAPASFRDAALDIYFAEYATSVRTAGGAPVFLPLDADPRDFDGRLDGIVLAGGEDIDPARYGAHAQPELGALDPARDAFEFDLVHRAMAADTPILGICRGQQVLNVALGGSLVQHLDGHMQEQSRNERTETVVVQPGTRHAKLYGETIRVNSFHHQSVDRLGEGVVVAARDERGSIEAIDVPQARAMAVQWHPETFGGDPAFDWLINEAREGAR